MWKLGDYDAVAPHLHPISVDLVAAAGVTPGQRVLDIGVGNGGTAVCAAAAGARVLGVDLSPAQLDRARRRLTREGVDAELLEANAEDLPFEDGEFDLVLSSMGVIFAPDHAAAAAEMARVVPPGGTVALTAWTGGGWSGTLWERAGHLLPPPPPGAPRSEAWGDPEEALGLLSAAGITATVERREFYWQLPSVAEGAQFFAEAAGPFVALFAAAEARGTRDQVAAALVTAMDEANQATDGTCRLPAPYLVIVGTTRETSGP